MSACIYSAGAQPHQLSGIFVINSSTISRVGEIFYNELDKYGTPAVKLIVGIAKMGAVLLVIIG
jgi:hypothetical protein